MEKLKDYGRPASHWFNSQMEITIMFTIFFPFFFFFFFFFLSITVHCIPDFQYNLAPFPTVSGQCPPVFYWVIFKSSSTRRSIFHVVFLYSLFLPLQLLHSPFYIAVPDVGHDHNLQLFHFIIYRVSQEECARLRESVPYVKLYRYNPKHL